MFRNKILCSNFTGEQNQLNRNLPKKKLLKAK